MAKNSFQISWSEVSLERLNDIYFWHCIDHSERRADKIIDSIEKAVRDVSAHPYSAPIYEEAIEVNEAIRVKVVHGTYKVVFKIERNAISVIDIFHAAQEPESANS